MQTAHGLSRSPATSRRPLILAAALGLVAAILTANYLQRAQAAPALQSSPAVQSVVVARQDISPGQRITPSMVEIRAVPQALVPTSAFSAIEMVADRTVRYPVAAGEPLTEMRLVSTRTGEALSFTVPAGLRAFTIPINVNRSPAALLTPGDFVDVIAIMASGADPRTNQAGSVVVPALAGPVQVLAVQRYYLEKGEPYVPSDRATPPGDSAVTYLTLAVTPDDAMRLAWYTDQARSLTVALRAFGDEQAGAPPASYPGQ